MSNSTAFNNVRQKINHRLYQEVLPRMGEILEDEVMDLLTDKVYWPYFEGVTTVRQNPNASQPVAVGAYRDSRDTDDLILSTDSEVTDEGLEVWVTADDADEFYETRPIYDVLLSRVNMLIAFEESWNETA